MIVVLLLQKIRTVEQDGKTIKLQIVSCYVLFLDYIYIIIKSSGICMLPMDSCSALSIVYQNF